MTKHRPVSDDELVKLIFHVDDIGSTAALIARRLHATRSPVELPIERALIVAHTAGALTELVTALLHWPNQEEQQFADEQATPPSPTPPPKTEP